MADDQAFHATAAPGPDFFAFLLDAWARFGREGTRVSSPLLWLPRLGLKPALPVLGAAVRDLKRRTQTPRTILEFGVYKGTTIRYLGARLSNDEIVGFDSFEGFPEDGRTDWRMDFSVPQLPAVPANVRLVVGMFDDTLPVFDASMPEGRTLDLIHIDCDIYSSTASIFHHLGHRIGEGTIIVFDELLNYSHAFTNEILAFHEFLQRRHLGFRWLATVGTLPDLEAEVRKPTARNLKEYRKLGHYQNAAVVICSDPDALERQARHKVKAAEFARIYARRLERRKAAKIPKPQTAA